MNMNLHDKIVEMKREFVVIQENYHINKYKLECHDDEYKDSEDNIFDDNRRWKLDQFIALEAQLYRNSSLRYAEMLKILKQLSSNIANWLRSMRGRTYQGISQAKKVYNSEKYYLQDMKIRLDYYTRILCFLDELEQYESDQLKDGIELSADSEYDAYLLNKCVLLSQVGYCKNECTRLVKVLNNRVSNSPLYNGDFYYKLAELNFGLQRYQDAQRFLEKTIDLLKYELREGGFDTHRSFQLHDMLFAAYQLRVLGYEFCGDYKKAIVELTGKTPVEIVSIFKEIIPEQSFESLHYSSDSVGKHADKTSAKRKRVINIIDRCIRSNVFSSEMSSYVYNTENQRIFEKLVDYENKRTIGLIKSCGIREEYIDKVLLANLIEAEDVNIMNEYIHVLAHCINEYGVTFMKRHKNENEEELANNMLLLGRALMLYVSEKRAMYKSCYATTYAEAGDTWIARNELKRIIEDRDYANYDVTTKAEIAFFYYIINSMYLIENNEFDSFDEIDNGLYNRYLNYCYRNFDYDAIAHMRVYSFRNKIAELLQAGDLLTMAKNFLEFSKQKSNEKTVYQEFVDNVYFQNSNERLRCEYEKAKYMYQFLTYFFRELVESPNAQVFRSPQIVDYAFKYIHYYNASINNSVGQSITYVNFNDIESDIGILTNLLTDAERKNNIVASDHCRLVLLYDDEMISDFIEHISKYDSEAHSKMFFLACNDVTTLEEVKKLIRAKNINIYPRFRMFASLSEGIKEFIIFTTFFIIKDDFFNPNNIFVMTPIGTAKACRYRIANSIDLIEDCFAKNTTVPVGIQKEINTQYRAVAEASTREMAWESGLNSDKYREYVSYVVSVTYDCNSNSNVVKYKYKYDVSDQWKEARLFSPSRWQRNMENIYSMLKYESSKIVSHRSECSHGGANCSVVLIDNVDDGDYDVNIDDNDFVEVTKSLVNIGNNRCQKALVWRGTNNSYVSWRFVSLDKSCPIHIINEIRQIMCCKGQELVFAPVHDTFMSKKYKWPDPHDYLASNQKFLFVSHAGRDDELVKQELNEFFVKHKVPLWYDKEKLVKDDTWKERVMEVISHPNCAGVVVLVTNSAFFKSEAIQYELMVASAVKKKAKKDFAVLPIIYGVASNYLELRNLILTSIDDDDTFMEIKKIVVPDNNKVITYLCPNQSLVEYTQNEVNDGRNGSVVSALLELKII